MMRTPATELQTTIDGLLALGKQMALAQMSQQGGSEDPIQQAAAKYTQRISEQMFQLIRPVRTGNTLTFGGRSRAEPWG